MTAHEKMSASVEFVNLSEGARWRELLSDDERLEAGGISNLAVRSRFEIGRGLRRKMLSEATGLAPEDLAFYEDKNGKPRPLNVAGWDFNASHSGNYVAVVVGCGQVGIDIEEVRPVREMESIVARYFHPDEAAAWSDVAPSLREEAFFMLWSAREASMKCVGLGLARGLAVTRVEAAILAEKVAFARVGDASVEVRRLSAPQGYVAMVAQAAA